MNSITSHHPLVSSPCTNGDKARFRQKFHKGNYSKWLHDSKLFPCDHQVSLSVEGCSNGDDCVYCSHTSPAKKSPKDYWLFKHKSHFLPTSGAKNSISPQHASILANHVSLSTEALISPYLLNEGTLHSDKKFVKHKKSMQRRYQHQQEHHFPQNLPPQHNSNIFTFPTILSSNINKINNGNNIKNTEDRNGSSSSTHFPHHHLLVSPLMPGYLHAHNINNNKYSNNNNVVMYTSIKDTLSSRPCSAPYHRQPTPGGTHKLPPVSPRVFTFDDLHYSPSFHDVNEDKNNNNSNNEGYATKSPLTPTTYIREKLHASTIVDKSTSLVTNPSINIPNGSVSSDKLGSIINNESIDLSSVSCKMNVDGQAKAYNGVRVVSQHVTNFITTSETNHNSLVSSTFQHYSPTFVTTKAFSTFVTTKPSSAFVTTKSSSTSTKSLLEAPKVHHCGVCDKLFSRSDMLTRHMRLHNNLKPYKCHVCLQVFSRSDHLQTHLRTHTGEKPYRCHACSYAAPRRDMVTRHLRVHSKNSKRGGRYSAFEGCTGEENYAKGGKVVKNAIGNRVYSRKRRGGKTSGCVRDGGQKVGEASEGCRNGEEIKSGDNAPKLNCKYNDDRGGVNKGPLGVPGMFHEGKDIKKENNQNESNIFSTKYNNVDKKINTDSVVSYCNNILSQSYESQHKLNNTPYHHLPLDLTNKSTYNTQKDNNLTSTLNNTCHSLESIQSLSSNTSPQYTNQSLLNTAILIPNFHYNLSPCDHNNLKMYSKNGHNVSHPLSSSHLCFFWPVVTEPCMRADRK